MEFSLVKMEFSHSARYLITYLIFISRCTPVTITHKPTLPARSIGRRCGPGNNWQKLPKQW